MALGYFALAALLASAAVTLTGCGGGGSSPKQLDLVSQSLEGKYSAKVGATAPQSTGPIRLFLDVDRMDMRIEMQADVTEKGIEVLLALTAIINGSDKRLTVLQNTTIDGHPSEVRCWYQISPIEPSPSDLRSLLKAELQKMPVKNIDGGYRSIEYKSEGNTTADIKMEFDDGNLLHKLEAVGSLNSSAGPIPGSVSMEMTSASGGPPPATTFVVPASWGKCEERPYPAVEADAFTDFCPMALLLPALLGTSVPSAFEGQKATALVV